ncbi:hypothetical protein BpHYR1_036649 [Brachionus plicatilis]|uniref:Uncharacterized protein n=1 Tax=Brachionus plicatilis TaxID=10195 RepID=A0A3M7SNT3_BRAPC|nr:hypothetical protein BpHYR1_036649 [Brachionus plicatilis]
MLSFSVFTFLKFFGPEFEKKIAFFHVVLREILFSNVKKTNSMIVVLQFCLYLYHEKLEEFPRS